MLAALGWVKYGAAKAVPMKEQVEEGDLEEEEQQMEEEEEEEKEVSAVERARMVCIFWTDSAFQLRDC